MVLAVLLASCLFHICKELLAGILEGFCFDARAQIAATDRGSNEGECHWASECREGTEVFAKGLMAVIEI